ncbi:MAG: hypothetical protein IPK19_04110 [Chloroflexi bacterium]|nr:hypothetical protein [Chloroflexota bacterium]
MNWMPFIGPNFTMQIPRDWMIVASRLFQVMFLSPPMQDGRSVNVILLMHTAPESPEAYLDEVLLPGLVQRPQFTELSRGTFTTESGLVGAELTFTSQVETTVMLQQHVLFKRANTVHQFVATTPTDLPDELLQAIRDGFAQMIASFTFTERNLEESLGVDLPS